MEIFIQYSYHLKIILRCYFITGIPPTPSLNDNISCMWTTQSSVLSSDLFIVYHFYTTYISRELGLGNIAILLSLCNINVRYAIIDIMQIFSHVNNTIFAIYHRILSNIAEYYYRIECTIEIYSENQCCNPQMYNFIQQLLLHSLMAHTLNDAVLHTLYQKFQCNNCNNSIIICCNNCSVSIQYHPVLQRPERR